MTDIPATTEITAKAKAWLANGGEMKLRDALAKADEASRQLSEEARVDWRALMEPCTI